MVLDTDTLLEHVAFLRQLFLFPLLLVRNLSALLISNVWPKSGIIPPLRSAGRVQTHDLPFRIALPHIVIRELDGFKTGGRSDSVRIAARQANRWILAYLQGQKRSVSTFLSKDAFEMIMRAAIAAGGAPTDVAAAAEATIAALNPPEAWALHFETARQHKERMKEDPAGQGEAELMTNRLWISACRSRLRRRHRTGCSRLVGISTVLWVVGRRRRRTAVVMGVGAGRNRIEVRVRDFHSVSLVKRPASKHGDT